MAIQIPRGSTDPVIDQMIEILQEYQEEHPQAQIDIYRQNSVSIRIRIVDASFAGLSKPARSQDVWRYLEKLSEEAQADLSTILLLTPAEKKNSFANFEFDDPLPSTL